MKRIATSFCLLLVCAAAATGLNLIGGWARTAPLAKAPQQKAAAPNRLNILWLIAEDCGVELGCYGAKEVWTLNLDRLASEGARDTKAYTTAPDNFSETL